MKTNNKKYVSRLLAIKSIISEKIVNEDFKKELITWLDTTINNEKDIIDFTGNSFSIKDNNSNPNDSGIAKITFTPSFIIFKTIRIDFNSKRGNRKYQIKYEVNDNLEVIDKTIIIDDSKTVYPSNQNLFLDIYDKDVLLDNELTYHTSKKFGIPNQMNHGKPESYNRVDFILDQITYSSKSIIGEDDILIVGKEGISYTKTYKDGIVEKITREEFNQKLEEFRNDPIVTIKKRLI